MNSTLCKAGAICAILSAFTTIGIHAVFKAPTSFEDGLQLYKTFWYIFNKWWVICHCLLVIISVYSLAHYLHEKRRAFAHLGFSFYFAFGMFEIVRMFLVLYYLRDLRDAYLLADDEVMKQVVRQSINNVSAIGNVLFSSFTVSIILGNLFIGWACLHERKYIRYQSDQLHSSAFSAFAVFDSRACPAY